MSNTAGPIHRNADMQHARFENVNLLSAAFADVNLRDSTFENVALDGATLRNVALRNVRIANANLEGMTIDGVLVTELLRAHAKASASVPAPRAAAVLYASDVARLSAFYAAVAAMRTTQVEGDHTVLESAALQLFVVAVPAVMAATIKLTTPPQRREDTPIKLAFVVPDLAAARLAATQCGGGLNGAERQWVFQGWTVCDGHDPEGNVVQFRAAT